MERVFMPADRLLGLVILALGIVLLLFGPNAALTAQTPVHPSLGVSAPCPGITAL
jgi:hypothetical protein